MKKYYHIDHLKSYIQNHPEFLHQVIASLTPYKDKECNEEIDDIENHEGEIFYKNEPGLSISLKQALLIQQESDVTQDEISQQILKLKITYQLLLEEEQDPEKRKLLYSATYKTLELEKILTNHKTPTTETLIEAKKTQEKILKQQQKQEEEKRERHETLQNGTNLLARQLLKTSSKLSDLIKEDNSRITEYEEKLREKKNDLGKKKKSKIPKPKLKQVIENKEKEIKDLEEELKKITKSRNEKEDTKTQTTSAIEKYQETLQSQLAKETRELEDQIKNTRQEIIKLEKTIAQKAFNARIEEINSSLGNERYEVFKDYFEEKYKGNIANLDEIFLELIGDNEHLPIEQLTNKKFSQLEISRQYYKDEKEEGYTVGIIVKFAKDATQKAFTIPQKALGTLKRLETQGQLEKGKANLLREILLEATISKNPRYNKDLQKEKRDKKEALTTEEREEIYTRIRNKLKNLRDDLGIDISQKRSRFEKYEISQKNKLKIFVNLSKESQTHLNNIADSCNNDKYVELSPEEIPGSERDPQERRYKFLHYIMDKNGEYRKDKGQQLKVRTPFESVAIGYGKKRFFRVNISMTKTDIYAVKEAKKDNKDYFFHPSIDRGFCVSCDLSKENAPIYIVGKPPEQHRDRDLKRTELFLNTIMKERFVDHKEASYFQLKELIKSQAAVGTHKAGQATIEPSAVMPLPKIIPSAPLAPDISKATEQGTQTHTSAATERGTQTHTPQVVERDTQTIKHLPRPPRPPSSLEARKVGSNARLNKQKKPPSNTI